MTVRRAGGRQIIPRPPDWTPGAPPPWTAPQEFTSADVLAALPGKVEPIAPHFEDSRLSAVLVVLADGPSGSEVLLTRRSWQLNNHKGEISFPGGRADPGESPRQAALREAFEEVGLDPASVDMHGELDHLNTIVSRSYIVPLVGRVAEKPDLRPMTREVDRILWVPLAELMRADTFREERWTYNGASRPMFFYELDDETIWGATGRILTQLIALATGAILPPAVM